MLASKYEILSELNKYHDIPDQYIFLKNLEKSIGKEIDRNMLILLDRADEIAHTYKKDENQTSIEAYRILPNGIDYLEECDDKRRIERLSKINLFVAFITLIASIIAAVVGIISLTS
ncbi:hypothetical protein MKC73_20525 [[Clostridium] innocuum]|nr:hypothetical protein [[Clostridium] innocuum]